MKVLKRNGQTVEFDKEKVINAVYKAIYSVGNDEEFCDSQSKIIAERVEKELLKFGFIDVESIQNIVERFMMSKKLYKEAKSYILYREKHKDARFIKDRIDYMERYSKSSENAATSSETDANANVSMKNVANLEGEVYKSTNRIIQRQRMKDKLKELYPEVAEQYEKDLQNHIIYTHDEASTPVLKFYCCAVTLYPLMTEGVGNIDGVTPTPPNDIQSFSGQITNLVFLLSSQCKGAVALGDYFIALNYYVRKEFGEMWHEKIDVVVTNSHIAPHTISYYIRKGMKQFIYGVNQPAGNRSFNSPFTNVSYYDHEYFTSLFGEFCYPDGTKPSWEEIDKLQRMFMQLHRELRLIKPLTFPVSTMAMVHNGEDFIDKDYKELCAEEWAKGGSFFCYNSNNPSSIASCCRVLNEISENTFSSTTGMTGVMTGSCNVITLNISRIVQNYYKEVDKNCDGGIAWCGYDGLKKYLINILERVYKYHIAYKTMLYDTEDNRMFAASNAGYIYIKKLYSTIGILGYTEAAQFLGMKVGDNPEYVDFLTVILETIKEQNKLHSIRRAKRPFLFNSEAVPGENLAVKFYKWDKADGYYVPENQNLYNSYFYNPWDNDTNILDKFKLHGKKISAYTDGGQAAHINMDAHLSKEQYLKLLDVAVNNGTNYFTFNIPMSECADCGHVVNAPIDECPICHSKRIKYWTRIIGYLTCVNNWSNDRQIEQRQRIYSSAK